ncbi:MAG: peptidoglycan-associated lipoprotein Pal [Alphaproteobacteria bacterium]|nr:peptidoglycan-associated lipoprotein Pal [Alphaproteobacteria bacterium]
MLARYLMIFVAMFVVSSCSSTDDESMIDNQADVEREGITESPLSDIYGEEVQGFAPGTQADLVVNIGDRIFFGYDRYDLSNEALSILDAQANWLAQYPNLSITVEGHADERGTREYNLALGDRRASSVKSYLIALGIDPNRVNTISYGKERPSVLGANDSSWAQNRRGVTKID